MLFVSIGLTTWVGSAGTSTTWTDEPGVTVTADGALTTRMGGTTLTTFGRTRSNLELPLFTLKDGQVRPLVERPKVEELPEDSLAVPPDSVGTQYLKYEY